MLRRLLNSPPGAYGLWITVAFVLKGIIWCWLLFQLGREGDGLLGIESHDAYSYFDPIDHWLVHGEYKPDYRLPGFAPLYLPLRFFMERVAAWNVLVLIQFLLSVISTYLLGLAIYRVTQSRGMFLLTFFGYALSTYVSVFDVFIASESLATSFLVVAFYFLAAYWATRKHTNLLASGLFITWLVFLKPAFALVPLITITLVALREFRSPRGWRKVAAGALVFMTPLIVCDGLWMLRNYRKYEGIYPFSRTMYYPGYYTSISYPVCEFVTAIGGSFVWWEPDAEARWFGMGSREIFPDRPPKELPSYIYTQDFNRDSLLVIREKFTALTYDETPQYERAEDSLYLFSRLPLYQASFREHKPFHYHVVAPLRLVKRFLFHSGTYNLLPDSFSELNLLQKFIKLVYSGFYIAVLVLGLAGALLAVIRVRQNGFVAAACAGLVFYSIVLFPMVLRLDEFRYFVPSWPFLIICASIAVMKVLRIFDSNLYPDPLCNSR